MLGRLDRQNRGARCHAHFNGSLHPHGSLLQLLSMSNYLSSMYLVTLGSVAAGICGFAGGDPATDGSVLGMTPGKCTVPAGNAAWASTLHATLGLIV